MKKTNKAILIFVIVAALISLLTIPAFAITENEVQQQVNEKGKEAVTGNVFIWFLCAIAFLKVSQKIDSFMSSLGINVGHTGGSMLGEAMIAARGITAAKNGFSGGGFGRSRGSGTGDGGPGAVGGAAGFASGGLVGMVGRQLTRGAVSEATGQGGNVISKKMFQSSLNKGGDFANNVVASVAKGSVSSAGTITGPTASQALTNYLGFDKTGKNADDKPLFNDVEIGGGRITGMETSLDHPDGQQFAMYNADQYMEPSSDYSTVKSVDGSKWYMQYATDTVKKEPYMDPKGKVAYNESIIKKLPEMPRRKDRV